MRTILVIGIGAGNPDYLTLQAIKAMNRAEKALLSGLRALIAETPLEERVYDG